jgi:hypothetical protein
LPIGPALIQFISDWTSERTSVQEALDNKARAFLGSKD